MAGNRNSGRRPYSPEGVVGAVREESWDAKASLRQAAAHHREVGRDLAAAWHHQVEQDRRVDDLEAFVARLVQRIHTLERREAGDQDAQFAEAA